MSKWWWTIDDKHRPTDPKHLSSIACRLHTLLSPPRKWLISLGGGTLSLIALVLTHEPILLSIGNFLIVKDDLQPADLIHVLGGREERVVYALYLYRQDYSQKLFFSGEESAPFYKMYAIKQGVPANDLLQVETRAKNTYEEALDLEQLLESRGTIQSVIIVSSPYHLRRAQWVFKRVLGERVKVQFAPVPFEHSYESRRWWTNRLSRQMVASEYLKLLFYYVRYQFQRNPTRG